jgi:hypothetical protein
MTWRVFEMKPVLRQSVDDRLSINPDRSVRADLDQHRSKPVDEVLTLQNWPLFRLQS